MSIKNLLIFTLLSIFTFSSCDIDQTREGELPEVDVDIDAEEGQLPAFDVDWADVNVGTRTKTIEVPKVRVVMEEEQVEVPFIDVDMPDAGDKEELTLVAEAEVADKMHELEIVEVLADGKRLYVLAELEATDDDLGEERVRVSDRLVLNAPDLDVKYYIIGERPDGTFNTQYSYVSDRAALNDRLSNATSIYKK